MAGILLRGTVNQTKETQTSSDLIFYIKLNMDSKMIEASSFEYSLS
jgi:hypothetical protein